MSEILRVQGLKKYFKTKRGMLHAVDDVSFSLEAGKTLGVVGESGCGKSTLGRTIVGLQDNTGGEIHFDGRRIDDLKTRERKKYFQQMQLIFQDPFSSLNPRMCVYELIAEPLRCNHIVTDKAALRRRVLETMDTVGLPERLEFAYPHELDGGRRQRIGIARALALNPRFIVCDEPVSALDVSIQAQILNLLEDLQKEKDLTYIFITHDLSVVKHISDDIMVMYLGTVVESCASDLLFQKPMHPYTQGLLSAIPLPSLDAKKEQIILQGELSSPINPKPGCRFAARCPYADDCCRQTTPELRSVESGHMVACHRVDEIPAYSVF